MQEDRIGINIELADDAIQSVQILSRRNLQACRIFTGKTAGRVMDILPLIYHVCGKAHALAARHAMARAAGETLAITAFDLMPLLIETCREHARRILLDWPVLCARSADSAAMLRIQNKLNSIEARLTDGELGALQAVVLELQLLFKQDICGQLNTDISGWSDLDALHDWCRQSTHSAAGLPRYVMLHGLGGLGRSEIPAITLADIDDYFIEDSLAQDTAGAFISRPHWQNRIYETGPLARMQQHAIIAELLAEYGNGLFTRLIATLLELLHLPQRMLELLSGQGQEEYVRISHTGQAGTASAVVEAARGCLWHRVEMQDSIVQRYQILAPTEWNFHPQGALVQGLHGTPVRDTASLLNQVKLMSLAMDPCVACDVAVM